MKLRKLILGTLISLILVPFGVKASNTYEYIFNEIFPDGKIEVDAVRAGGQTLAETILYKALEKYDLSKYKDLKIGYYPIDKAPYDKGEFYVDEGNTWEEREKYTFDIVYKKGNESIIDRVDSYIKKFPQGNTIEERLIVIEDLEIINYMYNGGFNPDGFSIDVANSVINYSIALKNILENSNLTVELQTRAGWDDQFSSGGFGDLLLLYNGISYGDVPEGGVKGLKVLYVPDDTEDTREAYISKALERVENYIGKGHVKIEYAGQIADISEEFWLVKLAEIVDVSKTLGEYYTLTIDGVEHNFFISKDSSKMQENPVLKTTEMENGVSIETKESQIPLDASINAINVDKDSDEYKEIIKKLQLNDGKVFDINLFSNSKGEYITKLENGNFKVYIPIDEAYNNKDLIVYYIDSNGNIEEHAVTVEGNYASFETDHFSTYTLGVQNSNETDNPKTNDAIIGFVIIGSISLIVLGTCAYKKIKRKTVLK